MEIPLFSSSEEKDVLITPQLQAQNLSKNMGLSMKHLPKRCILAAMNPKRVEKSITGWGLKQEITSGFNPGAFPYKIYSNGKAEFLLAYSGGMGPSSIANTLELLIALGVEEIYIVGMGGGLQELGVGEVIVATEAIRDEGVSYHYLDKSKKAKASGDLVKKAKGILPKAHFGKVWTTDCMYRETKTKFLKYKKDGALIVDMETASAYAVAEFRKVKVISFFIISDILKLNDWKPQFNSEAIDAGAKKIVSSILGSF